MKIVVCGNYGAQNLGDEMILEGLLHYLNEKFNNPSIQVMSANPQTTAAQHHVATLKMLPAGLRSFIKSILQPKSATQKAIKECDLFVLGGGGLFASQSKLANIIWWLQTRPALKYRKPIHLLGQSLGAPHGLIEKHIIKKIFQAAKEISVRDESSKKKLQHLGIKTEITVKPDFAFNTKPHYQHQESSDIVTISLRHTDKWPIKLKSDLTDLCNWLIDDKNLKINFINFQQGPHSDHQIHSEIAQGIHNQNKVRITNPKTPTEAEQEIASSKILIGMRLHSLITAVKTKTPFIAISYGEKIVSLLTDLNYKQNLLPLEDSTLETIKAKLTNLSL